MYGLKKKMYFAKIRNTKNTAYTYSLLPAAVRSFRHQFSDVRLMLHVSGSGIRGCACPSFTPEFATSRGRLQTARRPNALCQVSNCLAKCKHLARATPISSAIKSRYTI